MEGNGILLRLLGAAMVALLLGLPVAQTTRAVPPDGDTSLMSWITRADADIAICGSAGGLAEMDFIADEDGNIIGVTVVCSPFNLQSPEWACTETATTSVCSNIFPAPTPTPPNDRAPINTGVKEPVDTRQPTPTPPVLRLPVIIGASGSRATMGQPTPTPLPPLMVDTLQNQTTAEMDRCTAQGGTPTRIDAKAGDDLHDTLVQCKGGDLDGTVCLNTTAGATCQPGKGQQPRQPVLQIQNPGARTTPPAATTLLPGATPIATPAPTQGGKTVISGIAVKPGPVKTTDFTSAISVSAWTCYGPVPNDQATLKTRCKDLHNIDFQVVGTGIVTQFPKGDVRIGNLPAGQYTVRELVPNGYLLAYTYCDVVPTGTPPPQVWTPISNVYDGYYEFSLAQGQTVSCNWFNLPNQPSTPTRPGNTVTNIGAIKAQATAPAATPGT